MRVTFYLKTIPFEHPTSYTPARKAPSKEVTRELKPGE